jgi:CP family cyanate transporter-like MFS transporter
VAPLVPELSLALGASAAGIAVLTALPVACFGLLAPLGRRALVRRGLPGLLVASCVLIAAGSTVRSTGGLAAALAGTLVIGCGIAWGNVAFPVVVDRDHRRRAPLAAAVATSVINVGGTLATIGAPAVAAAVGWRAALALPAPIAVAAALAWLAHRDAGRAGGFGEARVESAVPGRARPPRTVPPGTALLTVAFTGHTLAYYACSAWLPSYFRGELGLGAGEAAAAATVFQLTAIAGPLLVGAVGVGLRRWSRRVPLLTGLAWLTLPLGLMLAPSAWPVWVALSGLAQGSAYTVVMTLAIGIAGTPAQLVAASSRIQSVAYTVAALGPLAVGLMLDLSGSWTAPFAVVAAVLVAMTWCLQRAARRPRPSNRLNVR